MTDFYVVKSKKRFKKTVSLELTEKHYIGGGVGIGLTLVDAGIFEEEVPTNNEVGFDSTDNVPLIFAKCPKLVYSEKRYRCGIRFRGKELQEEFLKFSGGIELHYCNHTLAAKHCDCPVYKKWGEKNVVKK
jgi:hypothetical protein